MKGDGWVQEPDDVPWALPMQWDPARDIVPWRERESLAWRLGALQRDAEQLVRMWDRVERDGDDRLRALGLEPVRDPARETGRLGSALHRAMEAGRALLEALRTVDPTLPDDFLATVPTDRLEAGLMDGACSSVMLPDGWVVEVVSRDGGLEVVPDSEPVVHPFRGSASGTLSPNQFAWFEDVMDRLPGPPEPTLAAFLEPAVQDQRNRTTGESFPGIQSTSWRDVTWTPRSDREDAVAYATGSCPTESDPGRGGRPGWLKYLRGDSPSRSARDRMAQDSATGLAAPSYPWPGFRGRPMVSDEDHAAMIRQLRASYQDTTGLPFLPDGTYVGPGQHTQGGTLELVGIDPAGTGPDNAAVAWITPLGEDGLPTGQPPFRLTGTAEIRYEALPETDVRGGHM